MQRHFLHFFVFVVFAASLVGCKKDYTSRMDNVLGAMRAQNGDAALHEIDKLIGRAEAGKKPERNNLTLLLLERSSIHQMRGDFRAAADDLNAADQMLEILDLTPQGARNAAAHLFSGTKTVYHAPIYEKLLVNVSALSSYLAVGDIRGAAVEARRIIVLGEYFAGAGYENHPVLAIGYTLAGFAMELAGEWNSARRLYEQAVAIAPIEFATKSLDYIKNSRHRPAEEIAVIVLSGTGPTRRAERFPIGLVLGWVNDAFPFGPEETNIIGGLSAEELLGWVAFPVMERHDPALVRWQMRVDNQGVVPLPLTGDISAFALQQWAEMRPAIAMSAISRFLTRHAAQTALAASGQAVGGIGGQLMRLAGLATKGAMLAADIPDTRAWNSIPGAIFMARVPSNAGEHTLTMQGSGPGGQAHLQQTVGVPAGGVGIAVFRTVD